MSCSTVTAKMREKPVEDFFARNGRLREDNLMVHDLMLVQVKKPEESKYAWDYYNVLTTISGDEAFGPPDPACSDGEEVTIFRVPDAAQRAALAE